MKSYLKLGSFFILLCMICLLNSCSDNGGLIGFSIVDSYGVNDEFEISAVSMIVGNDLDKSSLFFYSSNESVAEIIGQKVVCKDMGVAKITANAKDSTGKLVSNFFILEVQEKATRLNNFCIDAETLELEVGELFLPKDYICISPANYIYNYNLHCSDASVLNITNNQAQAVASGECTLTYSITDFVTSEIIKQKLQVIVKEKATPKEPVKLQIKGLINDELIFAPNEKGAIDYNLTPAHSKFKFYTNENDTNLTIDDLGNFIVNGSLGTGQIYVDYGDKDLTNTQTINYKIYKPEMDFDLETERLFKDVTYTLTVTGSELNAENFIFEHVTACLLQQDEKQVVFEIKILENLPIAYYNYKYSYTNDNIKVFDASDCFDQVYCVDDFLVSFEYKGKIVEDNTLYLLNKDYDGEINHAYKANIIVQLCGEDYKNYTIKTSTSNIEIKNNTLYTKDIAGKCEKDIAGKCEVEIILLPNQTNYTLIKTFEIKELLVEKIELKYNDTLYLNDDALNSTKLKISPQPAYAINALYINVQSESENIEISSNIITIKSVSNTTATFVVQCGDVKKAGTMCLKYAITKIELEIKGEPVTNFDSITLGSSDFFVCFYLYSGDIWLESESLSITGEISNEDILSFNCENLSKTHYIITKDTGEVMVEYTVEGDCVQPTTFEINFIVI